MYLSPHSIHTTLAWDHMFRLCSDKFLTGLQNLQNPIYPNRLIFLKHCFYHAIILLFYHLPWLPFLTKSQLFCLAFEGLQDLSNSLSSQSFTCVSCPVTQYCPMTRNVSSPSIYSMPPLSPGCSSFSFQTLSIVLSPFPSWSLLWLPWLQHHYPISYLNHAYCHSIICYFICLSCLNYVLTFVSQEPVFFLHVLCRNSGIIQRPDSVTLAQCFVQMSSLEKGDGDK